MKVISLRTDFQVRDAGDPSELGPALDKIDLNGECEITFDLKRCLLDYPGSSAIINKVIKNWTGTSSKNHLTIILDYQLKMPTILSWLFLGCEYIQAKSLKGLTVDQFEGQIISCLQTINAKLTIRIEPISGQVSEKHYE